LLLTTVTATLALALARTLTQEGAHESVGAEHLVTGLHQPPALSPSPPSLSAYLDNGGKPWHFEVVYAVMQYMKRAHQIRRYAPLVPAQRCGGKRRRCSLSLFLRPRSFVIAESFVVPSERKALLAACMADETITLVQVGRLGRGRA
jgi:hypothetical protein